MNVTWEALRASTSLFKNNFFFNITFPICDTLSSTLIIFSQTFPILYPLLSMLHLPPLLSSSRLLILFSMNSFIGVQFSSSLFLIPYFLSATLQLLYSTIFSFTVLFSSHLYHLQFLEVLLGSTGAKFLYSLC